MPLTSNRSSTPPISTIPTSANQLSTVASATSSPATTASIGTRKRARSSSASDTSSSKRAISEDPSTSNTYTHPVMSLDDIDAYMAEQGEDAIANITIPLGPPPIPQTISGTASLAPSEKFSLMDRLRKAAMGEGDTWYLVSKRWWRKWEKACTGEMDKEIDGGIVLESDISPVDNSNLVDDKGKLNSMSLIEDVDVVFVPEVGWRSLVEWYGVPKSPLPRKVIKRGYGPASLELRPLELQILKLFPSESIAIKTLSSDNNKEKFVTVSCVESLQRCGEIMLSAVDIRGPQDVSYRIWRIEHGKLSGWKYSTNLLLEKGGDVVDLTMHDSNNNALRRVDDAQIAFGDVFVVEIKGDDGKWLVDERLVTGMEEMPESGSDAKEVQPMFSSGSDFFSKLGSSTLKKTNGDGGALKPAATITSDSSSSSTSANAVKLKIGGKKSSGSTVGLQNMGNTCFMNSALQCLAHTPELSDYFMTGVYKSELNRDNPLGMHGAIAEAYGFLLQRIFPSSTTLSTSKSNSYTSSYASSYAPRDFKHQLQRFAPQFSGYQQHDSQEFLAFLLDGLHEDLNRVLKKPYVEKPDWEGGGEKELCELAKESWDGYRKRNDSVIVDLFQGQYRSTLVCPECQKVSITFDPFMYLTLPLPVQKKFRHEIYYVPWDITRPHVKVPIEVGRNSSCKELRQLLGRWMDAEPHNLLILEVFSNRFYKSLDDTVPVADISESDVLVCFELPCPSRQTRPSNSRAASRAKSKIRLPCTLDSDSEYSDKDSVDDDDDENFPLLLPVHLCKDLSVRTSSYMQRQPQPFAQPFVVVLTKKQARSKRLIYEAIVDRLQRWVERRGDLFKWQSENGRHASSEPPEEEGDIVDEKSAIMTDDDEHLDGEPVMLKNVGPKEDLFEMHIQAGHEVFGTQSAWQSNSRFERWDARARGGKSSMTIDDDNDTEEENEDEKKSKSSKPGPVLLKDGDALFCEWDDNLRSYYFGDDGYGERSRWNGANWKEFIHPEYQALQDAAAVSGNKKGITLQDCLDEFTKEEQLGEDDLWYCPQCKKHQQAKKKFDLWSVPDILVVHLKRFSNSRILRDKIDVFVDFPVEGLDLEKMVGERGIGKLLKAQDVDIDVSEFGVGDLDEPLVYDLYAVDEHLGGLGGGHYRAYAKAIDSDSWYHYDDTYVTPAKADDAVNANAYLLFYRRRTKRPIGGKTLEKIEAAKMKSALSSPMMQVGKEDHFDAQQLPTPPDDPIARSPMSGLSGLNDFPQTIQPLAYLTPTTEEWPTPVTNPRSSPASSLPALDDGDPPSFDDSQFDDLVDSPPMLRLGHYSTGKMSTASPTSSNEAEPDLEDMEDRDEMLSPPQWRTSHWNSDDRWQNNDIPSVPRTIDHDYDATESDTVNPFEDQMADIETIATTKPPLKEIQIEGNALLDIDM